VSDTNPTHSSLAPVFKTIKNRRVTRNFSDEPLSIAHILRILEAARWAPSGGMRRLNNYVVVRKTKSLNKIRAASPGILSCPQAIIVICIDKSKANAIAFNDRNQRSIYVDLGTAAENMLLTAEELKIGACPVMSFHKSAIQLILDLPTTLEPAIMIILGYPAPKESRNQSHLKLPALDEIIHWEHYGGKAI
jgi:nitroreductase